MDQPAPPAGMHTGDAAIEADVLQIIALRSGDAERIARVLDPLNPLAPALIPHVIPLLGDPVSANAASHALAAVAAAHAGELIDALLNPSHPQIVRRRVARVLAVFPSPRAVTGLLDGLNAAAFPVRAACGRALAGIRRKHPEVFIDAGRVYDAVRREVEAGRTVWETQRSLGDMDDNEGWSLVDGYLRARTHDGLAHVFALLSIVLPPEPVRIAFGALHTDDARLRGMAMEYLDSALPPDVRDPLLAILEGPPHASHGADRGQILVRLVHAHPTILDNLQRLAAAAGDAAEVPQPSAASDAIAGERPDRADRDGARRLPSRT